MKIVKKHNFKGSEALELGFSPIGRPFMTVFIYIADSVLIDTGQNHMRQYVAEFLKQRDLKYVLLTRPEIFKVLKPWRFDVQIRSESSFFQTNKRKQ